MVLLLYPPAVSMWRSSVRARVARLPGPVPASGRASGRRRDRRRQAHMPQPSLAILHRVRPSVRGTGLSRIVSGRRAGDVIFVDPTGLEPASRGTRGGRSLDELPGPRPRPVLGNIHQIDLSKAHLALEGWAGQYGPTYKLYREQAASSRRATRRWSTRCCWPGPTHSGAARGPQALAEIGIKGVFNAEGAAWRSQRKLAVAALAQRSLKQLYPHIKTVADRVKRRWERAAATGEALDIVDEMKRFTVDITMLIAFGHDANTVEATNDVIQRRSRSHLAGMSRRVFATFPAWRFLELPSDRRLDRAFAAVREWLAVCLYDRASALRPTPAKPTIRRISWNRCRGGRREGRAVLGRHDHVQPDHDAPRRRRHDGVHPGLGRSRTLRQPPMGQSPSAGGG